MGEPGLRTDLQIVNYRNGKSDCGKGGDYRSHMRCEQGLDWLLFFFSKYICNLL
jgi:hypothetical protein